VEEAAATAAAAPAAPAAPAAGGAHAPFTAHLPQLLLRGAAGARVVARDVVMWRVDSLEDTPIGIALRIGGWEQQ
jgi:hypothetical protein